MLSIGVGPVVNILRYLMISIGVGPVVNILTELSAYLSQQFTQLKV